MKALILSVVIAFSSSFALACDQADGFWNSRKGSYTKANKQPVRTNPAPVLSVASTPTNGAPR